MMSHFVKDLRRGEGIFDDIKNVSSHYALMDLLFYPQSRFNWNLKV